MFLTRFACVLCSLLTTAALSLPTAYAQTVAPLRVPAAFDPCTAGDARARALFREAGRVFQHPRCLNCHPDGDVPAQGMLSTPHDPPVWRGPHNQGLPALECTSCHQDKNAELARIPGARGWHLAPRSMAWVGKSLGAICEAIKDPKRNGGKTLAQIVEHVTRDDLVAWGWEPGADREPVPGPHATFSALVAAWVGEGAACPDVNATIDPGEGDCP